jgi:3-oxoacyl-[acyl-carrier-protein] synthase-3
MTYARIAGTGSFAPEKVVTNADLGRMLGEDVDEFVSQVLGIRERRVCAADESTADLATEAARRALDAASVAPEELDLIVLATDTPEYLSPATSVVVQHRLGAKSAGTFDMTCACAGFVTALDTASKYVIADSSYRNVLVVGAYAMSKYLDWTDKKTATIFADGAGAVVLRADEGRPGFLASKLIGGGGGRARHRGAAVARPRRRHLLLRRQPRRVRHRRPARRPHQRRARRGREPADVALRPAALPRGRPARRAAALAGEPKVGEQ